MEYYPVTNFLDPEMFLPEHITPFPEYPFKQVQ